MHMTTVDFFEPSFVPDDRLIYSVVTARYGGKWLFVKHVDRQTWEIPGGHIEEGEDPDDAASRELNEETGALGFTISCVATYSVGIDGNIRYGRLYFAEVSLIGPVPDLNEISVVSALDDLPEELTYPDIQPFLFKRVMMYLDGR